MRSIRDVVDYAATHNSYFVIEYLRENEKVRETVSPAHVRCKESDLMYSVIGKQSWAYATFAATIQEADTLPTNSVSKLNFDSNQRATSFVFLWATEALIVLRNRFVACRNAKGLSQALL